MSPPFTCTNKCNKAVYRKINAVIGLGRRGLARNCQRSSNFLLCLINGNQLDEEDQNIRKNRE